MSEDSSGATSGAKDQSGTTYGTTTRVVLRLPTAMVEAVDRRAKNAGLSRNQWYENMTRWVLHNTYRIEKKP